MAPNKLIRFFQFAVIANSPNQMATILMDYKGKAYSVPTDVARIIHRNLGLTIRHAMEVNEYKIDYGRNPVPGIPVGEQ